MSPEELAEKLAAFLQEAHGAPVRVENLRRLTGGASRQTWSLDAVLHRPSGEERNPLVLRSDPRGASPMPSDVECRLLQTAREHGVPAPPVHLMGDGSLGFPFFLMERVEGETIARHLLRDDQYARARKAMPAQLSRILAAIHSIPPDSPPLEKLPHPAPGKPPAETEVDRFETLYRAIAPEPHPAFELAFRWLRAHLPPAPPALALVHGDYRIGNFIFGPEGARAILDWELAHVGDPMEDLGWICVRSWRFGNDALPVGGLGTREEFWREYEAAGGRPVDPAAVRFWEVFGNLRWGIICIGQARAYLDGRSQSVELAAIGRRTAETEWELLNLMEEADHA